MQRLEIEPDEITLHCVLEACGRAGRWVHGLRCGRRLQRSSAVGWLCCKRADELQAYLPALAPQTLPVWRQRRAILHPLAAAPSLSTVRLHPFHPMPPALAANRYFVALVDRFGAHRNVMYLEFADPDAAGGQPGFACSCCAGSRARRCTAAPLSSSVVAAHPFAPAQPALHTHDGLPLLLSPASAQPGTTPQRTLGHHGPAALPSPPPLLLAATLDLHFLTVMGCRVVLRAWLLHLKRSALAGHALPRDLPIRIVTGEPPH